MSECKHFDFKEAFVHTMDDGSLVCECGARFVPEIELALQMDATRTNYKMYNGASNKARALRAAGDEIVRLIEDIFDNDRLRGESISFETVIRRLHGKGNPSAIIMLIERLDAWKKATGG